VKDYWQKKTLNALKSELNHRRQLEDEIVLSQQLAVVVAAVELESFVGDDSTKC
jgi:hypothetical protein